MRVDGLCIMGDRKVLESSLTGVHLDEEKSPGYLLLGSTQASGHDARVVEEPNRGDWKEFGIHNHGRHGRFDGVNSNEGRGGVEDPDYTFQARVLDGQGRVAATHADFGPQAALDLSVLPGGLYIVEVAEWGWRKPLILH